MKINFVFILMIVTTSVFSKPISDEYTIEQSFSSSESPLIFFSQYESKLSLLNKVGTLSEIKKPWSDTYWPRRDGGIAYRWQLRQRPEKLYSKEEVLNLSQDQLKKLSPAEKLDLLEGSYNFSFTKNILRSNPKNASSWEGICDGWAEASLSHQKAKPKTLTNENGLKIEFGSSDIHAILSYYYAKEKKSKTYFLGNRCRRNWLGREIHCNGLNPASFHLVLAESFKRGKSFIIDTDAGLEVWNQPVAGYRYQEISSREPSQGSSSKTNKEVLIQLRLEYARELNPSFQGNDNYIIHRNLEYWLELDAEENIIGGSWVSRPELRVDFAWYRDEVKLPSRYQKLL